MKFSLLVHGPISDSNYEHIFSELDRSSFDFDQIVLVTYLSDKDKTTKAIRDFGAKFKFEKVFVRDVVNPGFANVNRQINMVASGLSRVPDENFVIKLRNDQCVNFDKLKNYLKNSSPESIHRIFTTCCYTRKDRLYHPSDMFLMGYAYLLKDYYSCPFMASTDLEIKLQVWERMLRGENLKFLDVSPESYLCRNYLKLKKWKLLNTHEDSFNALKNFFVVINTWDIDLTWKKKRNYPFKRENEIILPHKFRCRPFENGPVERAECYLSEDFGKKSNVRDFYFKQKSKLIWYLWPVNMDSPAISLGNLPERICVNKIRVKQYIQNIASIKYLVTGLPSCVYSIFKIVVYRSLAALIK